MDLNSIWSAIKQKASEAGDAFGLSPEPTPSPSPSAAPFQAPKSPLVLATKADLKKPKKKAAGKKAVTIEMGNPEEMSGLQLRGLPPAPAVAPPVAPKARLQTALPEQTVPEQNEQAQFQAQKDAMQAEMNAKDPMAQEFAQVGVNPKDFDGRDQDKGFKFDNKTQEEINKIKALTRAMQVDWTPKEMEAKYREAMQSPAVQEQLQGLKQQSAAVGRFASTPSQVDLDPVVDLVNSVWGGKFSHTGERARGDARQKQVMDYIEKIQDNRSAISKSVMDAVKAQKAGTTTEADTIKNMFMAEKLRSFFQEPKKEFNPFSGAASGMSQLRVAEEGVGKLFEGYSKRHQELKERLGKMSDAIKTKDYGNIRAMLSNVAKGVGADSGMLSNQDIANTLPRTMAQDLKGLEVWLSGDPRMQTDPHIPEYLVNLAKIALQNGLARTKSEFDIAYQQLKARKSLKQLGVPLDGMIAPYLEELKASEGTLREMDEFANDAPVSVRLLKDYKGKKAGDVVRIKKSQLKRPQANEYFQEVK